MTWAPLAGVTVGALGSSRGVRFAARTLASLGADVVRAAPPGVDPPPAADPFHGGHSEREERLSEWLDEGVEVLPSAGDAGATLTAAGPRQIVVHDADLEPVSADGALAVVSIGLGRDPHRPSSGLTAAARAGVAVAVGAPDREPLGLPFSLAEYTTGLVATAAALAGLLRAPRRAAVDAVGVLAAFAGVNGLVYEPYGIPWTRERRRASQCGGPYPYGFLRAGDGWICAIARSRAEWDRLVAAMGDPAWARSERYANLRRNGACHADELDELIEGWTGDRTRAELTALARAQNLALAPVRTSAEVLADQDLESCGFFRRGRWPRPGVPAAPAESAPTAARRPGPAVERDLTGLRVLDFGWVWSAPLVGSWLAGLGADVVKVEHRARPDNSRLRGRPLPGWIERADGDSLESVPYFLNLNHGKRSIDVDMKDPEGAALMRRLLRSADVVVENLGEPMFHRLGLHYDDVAAENERLVWLSMPTRRCGAQDMRGYAPTISSFSGLEAAIGYPGDMTGMMTFGLCDPVAGTWGLTTVLAALHERERRGRGRHLRLGQLEGFLGVLGEMLEQADREGGTPPAGNAHPYFRPHGAFPAADGRYVAVAALDDAQRAALARIVGGDARDAAGLEARLRSWLLERDAREAASVLRAHVACEVCAEYADARADPELQARGLLAELDHPQAGRHLVYTHPWLEDGRALPVARPAPMLGQHGAEVPADWRPLDAVTSDAAP